MTESEATPDSPPPGNSGLVDLSDLRMMPSWVAGMGSGSSQQQQLRRYEEDETRGRGGRGDRGDRRGPPRRDGGGFGGGFGGGGGPGRGEGRPPRRDGPPGTGGGLGGPRRDRDERGGPRHGGGDRGRRGERPQREWQEIPKDVSVGIEPEDKSAEALASHIRHSGHAFSMFDAARLVLAEGDRFHARFTCAPDRPQGLFATVDGGVFLTQDEAIQHVMRGGGLDAYYRVEEIELEEPKGDFKSIGVCGMTGELLGPPSHHSFQASLIRLHRDRFSHMPLEDYKRRVRVEANPELVAKWKEEQKKGYRWVALKDQPAEGEEPVTFTSRIDMEAHFRRTHASDAVREAREVVVHGNTDKAKMTHVLSIMLRHAVENARKHLFEMSQKLGGSFERRGLKLFKRRAGKLFVSRVKPRAVDPGVVFSDRVGRIVEVLKGQAGMPLHNLVEAIVPSAPPAEGESTSAAPRPPTDEQISVIKDVRWLANEGYVIEYSDGMVFLGVQGEPNPPKAAVSAKAETAAAPENVTETTTADVAEQPGEAAASEETSAEADRGEEVETEAPAPAAEEAAADDASEDASSSDEGAADELVPAVEAPGNEGPHAADEQPPEDGAPEPEPNEEESTAKAENPAGAASPGAEPDQPTEISASEEPVPPMGEESEKKAEF